MARCYAGMTEDRVRSMKRRAFQLPGSVIQPPLDLEPVA
jgi:hypothetical protein